MTPQVLRLFWPRDHDAGPKGSLVEMIEQDAEAHRRTGKPDAVLNEENVDWLRGARLCAWTIEHGFELGRQPVHVVMLLDVAPTFVGHDRPVAAML